MLDYLDGGAVGGVYGERLEGVTAYAPNWRPVWRGGGWNHLRARIEGDVPHIQVWLNGIRITDWRDTANHAADGAVDGMIAVQVHAGIAGSRRQTPLPGGAGARTAVVPILFILQSTP